MFYKEAIGFIQMTYKTSYHQMTFLVEQQFAWTHRHQMNNFPPLMDQWKPSICTYMLRGVSTCKQYTLSNNNHTLTLSNNHHTLYIREVQQYTIWVYQYTASIVSWYSDILDDTVQCVLADFYRWTEPFSKAIPFRSTK